MVDCACAVCVFIWSHLGGAGLHLVDAGLSSLFSNHTPQRYFEWEFTNA